ncbi:MAG: hypothetical protein E6K80_08750 [Candidatus Eisenbacteria bacterium]|uniref:DUF5916 domain-containing protein n=1 Tax=Eiseniibacteriota bacterium TaxID=2212470 RepID=A0A538U379_UNCEI|nr:MAG: hypothetical protein E6K80_08750 [Candidatus Eisenbacteria bacterium]
MGGTAGQLGETFCDRCTRGGPAIRQSSFTAPWVEVTGDDRRLVFPDVFAQHVSADEGHTNRTYVSPSLQLRISARTTPSLGMSYTRNLDNTQFYGNFVDSVGVTHYTFAHLDQTTVGLTFRLDYTASPTLTIQVYANPYASRFAPYGDASVMSNPGAFNYKAFNSSTVVRWEYRPGSSLYVVWTEGRQDLERLAGDRTFSGDLSRLFDAHPANTFLVKVAHWFDW